MRRRIVKVFRTGSGLNHEPLGTLTVDPEFQRVYWRPYRSRTVLEMRLSWVVKTLERCSPDVVAGAWRLDKARRRRRGVG